MKLSHDQIRGLLPEYIRKSLPDDERFCFEEHLKRCDECSQTLCLLREIAEAEVPDPGELFWKTLPQKIRVIAKEQPAPGFFRQHFSLRLLPFAPLLLLVMLIAAFAPLWKQRHLQYDPLFRDPLEYSLLEYGDISEKRIRLPRASLSVEEAELLEPPGSTYHREFVSLSSDELGRLYKTLSEKDPKGG